jgi:hypothetical protein
MYTNFNMELQQRNDIKTLLGWRVALQKKKKKKSSAKLHSRLSCGTVLVCVA